MPAGTGLVADPSLQRRDEGRLLMGGAPLRFLRLSPAGARVVEDCLEGRPVAASAGAQRLARRLIDAAVAHPVLPEPEADPPFTVVIPVRDDQAGLDVTMAALDGRWPVVVVDDASAPPICLPTSRSRPAGATPVRLMRREVAGGPGVARQTALALVDTPLVAFVDAGVELAADDLRRLGRWFADPTVVAAGPRVASRPGLGTLAAYEARRSPLDLGPNPSPVAPGRMVSYLPSAALAARTAAVTAAGGFDPALRYGEDVDLVWRLGAAGTIRYDPDVVAFHPPRTTLAGFARQRRGYGSSAAPLARRHGDRVAPVRLSGWSLACWALALAGRPFLAVGVAGGTAVALGRKLAPVLPDKGECARLTFRGHWSAGGSLADAAVREWWPVTALAALAGWRRPALGLVALAAGRRWRSSKGRPAAERGVDLALGTLDNVAYGAGVWQGAWRARSLRCLLPRLTSWPGRQE
ncbi:MAG: mycofactocin biosynthesis glycosyltransferase MftF [Acidimicrobiales bacterium]